MRNAGIGGRMVKSSITINVPASEKLVSAFGDDVLSAKVKDFVSAVENTDSSVSVVAGFVRSVEDTDLSVNVVADFVSAVKNNDSSPSVVAGFVPAVEDTDFSVKVVADFVSVFEGNVSSNVAIDFVSANALSVNVIVDLV